MRHVIESRMGATGVTRGGRGESRMSILHVQSKMRGSYESGYLVLHPMMRLVRQKGECVLIVYPCIYNSFEMVRW